MLSLGWEDYYGVENLAPTFGDTVALYGIEDRRALGFSFDLNMDVGAGYRWIWGSVGDMMLTNPIVYLSAYTDFMLELHLFYLRPLIKINLNGVKY